MPTYTFRCPKCKHEFSGIFPMKDSGGEEVICPKCKNKGAIRIYNSASSLLIKSKDSGSSCPTCPSCSEGVCNL